MEREDKEVKTDYIEVERESEIPLGYISPEDADEIGCDPGECDHPQGRKLLDTLDSVEQEVNYWISKNLYECPMCGLRWAIWEGDDE